MVMGIDDEWLAYDFDLAVSYLGITVQNRLDERDEDGKPTHDIYKALNVERPRKVNPPRSTWQGVQGVAVKG